MLPRLGLLAMLVIIGSSGVVPTGAAAERAGIGSFRTVVIEPLEADARLEVDGRTYAGVLEIRAAGDGLVLVEHTDLDGYLAGIAEVPFSWHSEALAAQVVAARSYLASTLAGERAGAGATYGFDICASSACQVYAGTGFVEGPGGERWAEAVVRTSNEILVYDGGPAQTFYHSTSGGRTEAIQDVWAGRSPVPYLVGAPSPGEDSPFADWSVTVPGAEFVEMFRQAGYDLGGRLVALDVEPSERGEGIWRVSVETDEGVVRLEVGDVRAVLNRYGDDVYPDGLPGFRENGRRYPQSILSYRFSLELQSQADEFRAGTLATLLPSRDLPPEQVVVIDGRGWGHHIGMSQYGALAYAERGFGYEQILAHYYGGLEPVAAPSLVPERIAVGLDWERDVVGFVGHGPFRVVAGDQTLVTAAGGEWELVFTDAERVALRPPTSVLLQIINRILGGAGLL
jgi:stage II sporulation protein D